MYIVRLILIAIIGLFLFNCGGESQDPGTRSAQDQATGNNPGRETSSSEKEDDDRDEHENDNDDEEDDDD